MPEHDIRVGHTPGDQSQPCAEREVVDDDRVGTHRGHHREHLAGDPHRLPHQVAEPGFGLEGQRGDHALPSRVEESPQGVVLPARLVLGADDARVRPLTQLQVHPLKAEGLDDRRGRGTRGHDDTLPCVAPRGAEGCQRQKV